MFKVLLVDDEELALAALRFSFPWEEYGFTTIITKTDPEEALQTLQNQRIDVAFVDIRMPEISGLDLLKYSNEHKQDTLFVIVSGYSDFSYAKQALAYGALDYLLKPISQKDVHSILKKVSDTLYQKRLFSDPLSLSELLSSEEVCQNLLDRLFPDKTDTDALTVLDIHSGNLFPQLKQISVFPPDKILFYSKENALLFWTDDSATEQLASVLAAHRTSAHFIYDVIAPSAYNLINALRRIRTERENGRPGRTGIVRLSSVSQEMTELLHIILDYVHKHYNEDLSLQLLSAEFTVNYTYMSELFHKATGKTFIKYLTEIRMSHACQLLSNPLMQLSSIAENVGYKDYRYFSKIFKRQFGMTPSEYRNSHKKDLSK